MNRVRVGGCLACGIIVLIVAISATSYMLSLSRVRGFLSARRMPEGVLTSSPSFFVNGRTVVWFVSYERADVLETAPPEFMVSVWGDILDTPDKRYWQQWW